MPIPAIDRNWGQLASGTPHGGGRSMTFTGAPPPEVGTRRRAGICIVDQTARHPRNVRSSRLSSSNPPGGPSLSGTTWAVKNCALPAGAGGRLRGDLRVESSPEPEQRHQDHGGPRSEGHTPELPS